jgi:WD40 repeat protein
LVSGSSDRTIKFLDFDKFSLTKTLIDTYPINCIEFINDTLLASGSLSTNYVYLWDINKGTIIKNLAHKTVTSLLFMNNTYLISGDVNSSTNVIIWKISDWNLYKQSTYSGINLRQIDLNNIAMIRWDQSLDTWDIRNM